MGTQELLETGRILLEMLKRDLRGISGTRFPFVAGVDEVDGKMVSNMIFVTSTPNSTNPFRWNKVGYTLIEDRQRQWVFVKKTAKNPNDDLDQLGSVFEVTRLVSSFRLALLRRRGMGGEVGFAFYRQAPEAGEDNRRVIRRKETCANIYDRRIDSQRRLTREASYW